MAAILDFQSKQFVIWSTNHHNSFYQVLSQVVFLVPYEKSILDFKEVGYLWVPIKTVLAILSYKSPWYFLPSFETSGLLVQYKKFIPNFQESSLGGHLGFPIGTILAIFGLTSTQYFLPKFDSIGISVQEKKFKKDF